MFHRLYQLCGMHRYSSYFSKLNEYFVPSYIYLGYFKLLYTSNRCLWFYTQQLTRPSTAPLVCEQVEQQLVHVHVQEILLQIHTGTRTQLLPQLCGSSKGPTSSSSSNQVGRQVSQSQPSQLDYSAVSRSSYFLSEGSMLLLLLALHTDENSQLVEKEN